MGTNCDYTVVMTADAFVEKLMRDNDFRDIGKYRVRGTVELIDRVIGKLCLGQGTFDRLDLGNSVFHAIDLDDSTFDVYDCNRAKVTTHSCGNAEVYRFHLSEARILQFQGSKMGVEHFHCGDQTSNIESFDPGEAKFQLVHTEDKLHIAYRIHEHMQAVTG